MATVVTKTIMPNGGGDYSGIASWEAANQGNLVTADEVREAACYSGIDATAATIDGSTTDATRYQRIYTPLSERHNGTRSPSKFLMEANFGSFTAALAISDDYCRVEGLQFHGTGTSVGITTTNCSNVRISDCLSYDCGSEGVLIYQGSSAITLMNLISLHCTRGFHYYNATTVNTLNCIAMGSTERGFWQENQTGNTYTNCYSGGNTGADWDVPASNNWNTVFSEDGTGTTTVAAYSKSTGACLANVTVGSEDPHIGASSTLKDAGTNLSGNAAWLHPAGNVDVIGAGRAQGAGWDVGPFEFVATTYRIRIPNRRVGPQVLRRLVRQPYWPPSPPPTGGSTFTIDLGGSISPTGGPVKDVSKPVGGSVTPAGAIAKLASKLLVGSVSPAGAIAKQDQKKAAGAVSPAGAIAKAVSKGLAGSISPAGAISKLASRLLAGAVSPAGALAKLVSKLLGGSISPAGALAKVKVVLRAFGGSISPSGVLTKQPQKGLGGSVSPTGTMSRAAAKLLSGAIAPLGSLRKSVAKVFSGAIAPLGDLLRTLVGANVPGRVAVSDVEGFSLSVSDAADSAALSDVAAADVSLSDLTP